MATVVVTNTAFGCVSVDAVHEAARALSAMAAPSVLTQANGRKGRGRVKIWFNASPEPLTAEECAPNRATPNRATQNRIARPAPTDR